MSTHTCTGGVHTCMYWRCPHMHVLEVFTHACTCTGGVHTCMYWRCSHMHVLEVFTHACTGGVHTCMYWRCPHMHVLEDLQHLRHYIFIVLPLPPTRKNLPLPLQCWPQCCVEWLGTKQYLSHMVYCMSNRKSLSEAGRRQRMLLWIYTATLMSSTCARGWQYRLL